MKLSGNHLYEYDEFKLFTKFLYVKISHVISMNTLIHHCQCFTARKWNRDSWFCWYCMWKHLTEYIPMNAGKTTKRNININFGFKWYKSEFNMPRELCWTDLWMHYRMWSNRSVLHYYLSSRGNNVHSRFTLSFNNGKKSKCHNQESTLNIIKLVRVKVNVLMVARTATIRCVNVKTNEKIKNGIHV